jgi:hypothetical protein
MQNLIRGKKSIIKKDLTGGFEFIRKKGDQVAWSTLKNSASQALRSSEEEEKKNFRKFYERRRESRACSSLPAAETVTPE